MIKKAFKYIFIPIILVSFVSCASFSKKQFKKDYIKLDENSANQLSGTYKIYPSKSYIGNAKRLHNPDTINKYKNLYSEILNSYTRLRFDSLKYAPNQYSIKLLLKNNKNLQITCYEKDSILKDTIITGKLKRGMFFPKNSSTSCWGVPYIFGGCTSSKSRIALSKNNNLIVNEAYDTGGAILIILAAGHSYNSSQVYERIK